MENAKYPYLGPHQKVHGLFIKKVSSFIERFKIGEDITNELLAMLQKWLINHIKHADGDSSKPVAKCLNKLAKKKGWLARTVTRFFG